MDIDNLINHFKNTNLNYSGILFSKINKNKNDLNFFFNKLNSQQKSNLSLYDISKDSKDEDKDKILVYLTCNWCSDEDLLNIWNKMSKDNNYSWDSIKIISDKKEAEYCCIINKPFASDRFEFDKKKTIILRMEPNMIENEEMWGKEWSQPNSKDFLFVGYHHFHYNNLEWHLSKNYNQLLKDEIIKNDNLTLSTILSAKYNDPGHIKRIDFTRFLETKNVSIDVFGSNKFKWKNFKGSLPFQNKDDGLLPYKYTFNVENNSIKNYFTEKLIDGILAECLVFYSGCPNVKDYIDEKAFVFLELKDFEHDYQIIKNATENDLYSKRLPFIKEAKQKILNELQFFPRLEKIIKKVQ
jgi:hypothetical protein